MKRYQKEFKDQVISDYIKNVHGYKYLAKKYGISRDTVREWVLSKKRKDSIEQEKVENLGEAVKDKNCYEV